jgi:anti-sigma factor (TIGR02949 family)
METMTDRMTCEEAVRQFFLYLDRTLEGEPLDAIEKHLEECLDCCDRLQFSRRVDAFVRARLGEAPLPEGLEERIQQGLLRARTRDAREES